MARRETQIARWGTGYFCVLSVVLCAFLAGCFERKQAAVLNPDGSGKVFVETIIPLPAQGPDKQKPKPLAVGQEYAAHLINSTQGVDAWSDLDIAEAPGNRVKIAATAYFPDINKLHFDMPIEYTWKRDLDGGTLTVQRTRTDVKDAVGSADERKKLVETTQSQYKEQQLALQTQLNAFMLEMSFEVPGDVTASNLFTVDGNKASLTLDGKKAFKALDNFMANTAALDAIFQAGKDLPDNDDIMLESMYGKKGPVSVTTKLEIEAKPSFDYRTEMRVAQHLQPDMLKAAGVELIPKFIVTPPTQPAPSAPPASRSAGRGR